MDWQSSTGPSRVREAFGEDDAMLEKIEQRLVAAAEQVVAGLPGSDTHTVAAAAMDVDGRIHTGVNVFHFTGGPCAELVVLGAAAAASAAPLVTIVAVGDGARGVLAPCGRCRQVLLDLHPDVYVIVPTEAGEPAAVPVRDLLPLSYRGAGQGSARRVVYFHPRYLEDIRSGRKTTTIRHRDPVQPGPAVFVFDDGEKLRRLDAHVDAVQNRRLAELTDDDARREAVTDADALRAGLTGHYPDLAEHDLLDVASFHLT